MKKQAQAQAQTKSKFVPIGTNDAKTNKKEKTKPQVGNSLFEANRIIGVRNFALYPKTFLAKIDDLENKKFLGFYEPSQKVWIGNGRQMYVWNVEDIDDGIVALYSYGRLFYLRIENGVVKEL